MGSEKLKKVIRLPYLDNSMIDSIVHKFRMGLNKGKKFTYNIPNTKGMTSDMVRRLPSDVYIRVAGGYSDEEVDRWADIDPNDDWMYECVVYSKDELADIIAIMESIENGIDEKWSDKKKAVYLYKSLIDRITVYGGNSEQCNKLSNEIRSLRGFINKSSVCAGFAQMYKELCDRNGIMCEMVLGFAGNKDDRGYHAWNELFLDGKNYPVDIMWDASMKNMGYGSDTLKYFAHNIEQFNQEHKPDKKDLTRLRGWSSRISTVEMKTLMKDAGTSASIEEAYSIVDGAGRRVVFGQVANEKIGTHNMFKYLVMIEKDGVWTNPQIVVSDSSISMRLKYISSFNTTINDVLSACRYLFSQENLQIAKENGTSYIGNIDTYMSINENSARNAHNRRNPNSYKSRKYKLERNIKLLPTDTRDGMCVQLVGQSNANGNMSNQYNCYRFVMNPFINGEGEYCRLRVVRDSFASPTPLSEITSEEVVGKVDFDTVLHFACGSEPMVAEK